VYLHQLDLSAPSNLQYEVDQLAAAFLSRVLSRPLDPAVKGDHVALSHLVDEMVDVMQSRGHQDHHMFLFVDEIAYRVR
jgi:hypothetical protein